MSDLSLPCLTVPELSASCKTIACKALRIFGITAIAFALSLPVSPASAQTDTGTEEELNTLTVTPPDCTFTQGFWKNHPDDWPVSDLDLGNVNYTKTELLQILNLETEGNGLLILAHQLISAKLNVYLGADNTCIAQAIIDADAMIGDLVVPPKGTDSLLSSETSALATILDVFNNGNSNCGQCLEKTNVLVIKTGPTETVSVGSAFDYTISACNDSLVAADDVVVTDTLPACAKFVSSVPPPEDANAVPLRWELGTLEPGDCVLITVRVTAECHTNDCDNTATVSTIDPETDYTDNEDAATVDVVDDDPPEITCPADATLQCPATAAELHPDELGYATATDNCEVDKITYLDDFEGLCGETGVTTRTWTATDTSGNSSSCEQLIEVVDTTIPTIDDVLDATVECGDATTPDKTGGPPAADDTCGNVNVDYDDGPQTDGCGNTYSFVRTWTAMDDCGNEASSEQTITVEDTTDPQLTCPGNITVPGPTGFETCVTVNYPAATASDTCGSVDVIYDPPSGTCFPCGTVRTVNVTAEDDCGNISRCSFTVTVGPCPDNGCSLTQGYWKNHPEDWPVDSLTLGTNPVPYTKAQLLKILNKPVKGNGLISLAHQLIAAKLNVANGANDSCIAATIDAADDLIGSKNVLKATLPTSTVAALVSLLDQYNNGLLCIPHCDDLEPVIISAQSAAGSSTLSKKAAKKAAK